MDDRNDIPMQEDVAQEQELLLYRVYFMKTAETDFNLELTENFQFAHNIPELGILQNDHLFKLSGQYVRHLAAQVVNNTIRNYRTEHFVWLDIVRNPSADMLAPNYKV